MAGSRSHGQCGPTHPIIPASANWWGWGKKGRAFTHIAVTGTLHFPENNTYPGETCWKLENQWFWEEGFKTRAATGTLARHMKTAHSRNANFLLNVGPDKQGRIIDSSLKVLAEIPAVFLEFVDLLVPGGKLLFDGFRFGEDGIQFRRPVFFRKHVGDVAFGFLHFRRCGHGFAERYRATRSSSKRKIPTSKNSPKPSASIKSSA